MRRHDASQPLNLSRQAQARPEPSGAGMPGTGQAGDGHEHDYIVRATAFGNQVRAFACRTTRTCREAVRLLDLSPAAAVALGRLMSGIVMLSLDLDQPGDTISAVLRCDGPLQGLTVVGEQQATVRGMVLQPVVDTHYKQKNKIDLAASIGRGTLTIIRDMRLKEPYVGRVQLVSGEIAEDLAAYLAISEQIPSVVSLGVLMTREGITQAGGLIVQLMPDAGDDLAGHLEERMQTFPDITALLAEGASPEEMLGMLLDTPDLDIHDRTSCSYACPCNRDRMLANLAALGREELESLLKAPDDLELTCHFCNQRYHFQPDEVKVLLQAQHTSRPLNSSDT